MPTSITPTSPGTVSQRTRGGYGTASYILGQTVVDPIYPGWTYVALDQYLGVLNANSLAVGSLIGSEIRSFGWWDLSGLNPMASASITMDLDTAKSSGLSGGQHVIAVDASISYADLVAGQINPTSWAALATGTSTTLTLVGGGGPQTVSLNSTILNAINAAIAGNGQFALGFSLYAVNLATYSAAMKGSIIIPPRLNLTQ